jgi:cytochrome c5
VFTQGRDLILTAATAVALTASLASAQDKPAGYVGSDTCQTCHDDLSKAFERNPRSA